MRGISPCFTRALEHPSSWLFGSHRPWRVSPEGRRLGSSRYCWRQQGCWGGGPSSAGAARGVLCPTGVPRVPAVPPKSCHPWDRGRRSQRPEVHRDREEEARRPRMRDRPRCTVNLGKGTLLGAHAQTGEGPEHKPMFETKDQNPGVGGGGGANLKGRVP